MAFADLASELSGYLPGLSGFLAENWINRAYRKIRDARGWSFLITDDAVVCPAAINTGTFSIVQYNTLVTANAAASAAFAALQASVGSVVPPSFLQLRFGGTSDTSQIYNIVSVDTTAPTAYVFTLDRVVEEATNTGSQYLCYRCYVAAPVSDFLRWLSFVDMVNGWKLYTDRTSWGFDAIDPQRQNLGQAYYLGSYKATTEQSTVSQQPIFELWPGPVQGQTFYVRYRRRGADFITPDDVQNDGIPDDLILQAALGYYAYPWAMANPGHFPAMKAINWPYLMADAKKTYERMLIDAKRQDDNTMMQSVTNRGHGLRDASAFPWPIDAAFLQDHLVPLG